MKFPHFDEEPKLIVYLVVALVVCGCKTDQTFSLQSNPSVMLAAEAMVFMVILKERGEIPEIPADRKGKLNSEMISSPESVPEFPFNTQFNAVMDDAPDTTYGFILSKIEESSPWAMSKAWKQSNGSTSDLTLPSKDAQRAANIELQRRKKDET